MYNVSYLVSRPRGEEGTGMPGSAAAAVRPSVGAIVRLRSGGLVDGRGGRLGRPRDALHNVVVRPQFQL